MVREIVVSEIDLDKVELEPGDFIPDDKFSEFDEVEDELILSRRKRKHGAYGEYNSLRLAVG